MQRERITDRIFVFRSDQYAQVTAGLVVTRAGSVLIDTLLYPEESLRIRRYVEEGLGSTVRYVVNTHFHADHTSGTCFFPDAQVISHWKCRERLATRGRESLKSLKESADEFQSVEVVLPTITFDEQMSLEVGDMTLLLWHSPGHSPDSIACLVEDEEVLFAADTVMPIPYFVDGSYSDLEASLQRLLANEYENIVQGHGDIILRGEGPDKIASDLTYLHRLNEAVQEALEQGRDDPDDLISLTECGKSPVLLNGVVQQLHQQNVRALIRQVQSDHRLQMGVEADAEAGAEGEGQDAWQKKRHI